MSSRRLGLNLGAPICVGVCLGLGLVSASGCTPPGCEPLCHGFAESGSGSEDSGSSGASETGAQTDPETEPEAQACEDMVDAACLVDEPIVVFDTTLGTMVAQLDAVRAPNTVDNFICEYLRFGFYDGTIIHRVIDGGLIQGGWLEPGLIERTPASPIDLELHPELLHVDGALAMARRSASDSADSQWYFTDGAQPGLDGSYAVFGVLIDGFDVRDAISAVPTQTTIWMEFELPHVPVEDVIVNSVYCIDSWP